MTALLKQQVTNYYVLLTSMSLGNYMMMTSDGSDLSYVKQRLEERLCVLRKRTNQNVP
jgi:hypothetical protein